MIAGTQLLTLNGILKAKYYSSLPSAKPTAFH